MSLVKDVQDTTCQIRTFCEMVIFSFPDLFDECGNPLPGETKVWMDRIDGWIKKLDDAALELPLPQGEGIPTSKTQLTQEHNALE